MSVDQIEAAEILSAAFLSPRNEFLRTDTTENGMMLLADFSTSLRLALRAKFVNYLLVATVVVAVSALLASEFSGRQPATVGLDVGLSVIRLVLPVIGALLVQELVFREFDKKYVLYSLTYPRSRVRFILARIAAVLLLAAIMLVCFGGALYAVVSWINTGYEQATPPSLSIPFVVTLCFMFIDIVFVLAVAVLASVLASTSGFVLVATLGVMIVARSFMPILALVAGNPTLVDGAESYRASLGLLGYLLPDLAALDVRAVALYGNWRFLRDDWLVSTLAVLAYSAAVVALSVLAIRRKVLA